MANRISNIQIDQKLEQLVSEVAEMRQASQQKRSGAYFFFGHLRKAFEALPQAVAEHSAMTGMQPPVDGLARAFMLSRVPHESAVSLAASQYCDCLLDLAFYDRTAHTLPDDQGNELRIRGKRQLEQCRKNLSELAVEIRDIPKHTEFDPTYHEVVHQIPVVTTAQVGAIAYAETPAFIYRDEFGQEQVIPAKVSVYVLKEPCNVEHPGTRKKGSPANGNGKPQKGRLQSAS